MLWHLKVIREAFLTGECNAFKAKRPVSKPIIFWTDDDIWEYIKRYNVPYCSIYDKGMQRTGCMFCLFGCQYADNRFDVMQKECPTIHDYIMNKLGAKQVLEFIKNKGETNAN